jgi:transposase
MRTGRPKKGLLVSAEQRAELERLTRRKTTAQALALRARIVLACADGGDNIAVAKRLGIGRQAVGRWRNRFIDRGVDGLFDEPRPGAPRKISDAAVENVVTLTLEAKPKDATHWSTRLLAKKSGLSRTSIARIWKAFGLRPHRSETFKLSADPLLIEKVRDIVGLYLNPPD